MVEIDKILKWKKTNFILKCCVKQAEPWFQNHEQYGKKETIKVQNILTHIYFREKEQIKDEVIIFDFLLGYWKYIVRMPKWFLFFFFSKKKKKKKKEEERNHIDWN